MGITKAIKLQAKGNTFLNNKREYKNSNKEISCYLKPITKNKFVNPLLTQYEIVELIRKAKRKYKLPGKVDGLRRNKPNFVFSTIHLIETKYIY